MIDVAALRVLVAAGMSASAIVDVIEADRKADVEAAAEKREAARQRQIKSRAAKKINEINDRVTGVTRCHSDSCDNVTPLPTLLPSPLTSTDSPLEKKEEVLESGRARSKPDAKSSKGIRLPDEWAPNEAHEAEAIRLGRDVPWMFVQADGMRLWAKANEHRAVARKSDWNATFTGWMRREAPRARAGPTNGHGAAPRPGSREDTRERTVNALRKLDLFVNARPDDAGAGGDDRAPILRVIPHAKPP